MSPGVSADRGPWIDLHSHAGRCFLAGLPAEHPMVASLGAASVAEAVRDARAAGMTALVLATVSDLAVLRPDPVTGLRAARDFRAGEETLRCWLNAAALVRPAEEGGAVVVMADPGLTAVQALLQWDPVGHARRELEDRGERHLPPGARIAELTGTPAAVAEELKLLRPPPGAEILWSLWLA